VYLLTARGIEEKTRVTAQFLQRKVREYEALRAEIEELRNEAQRQAHR
jgi:MarR family transcriptional regulator, temperature-dependent positive regulator of motility